MVLKTTRKITLAQARDFEDAQGAKGIKKMNIFHPDPCFWTVKISNPSMFNQFRANVVWKQIQPSELGDIYDSHKEMFRENLVLDEMEAQELWESLEITINPTDILVDVLNDVLLAGAMHYITEKRQIFGLTPSELEIV